MTINRRKFLKISSAAAVCSCIGVTGINGCSMIKGASSVPAAPFESFSITDSKVILKLSKIESLKKVGQAVKFIVRDQQDAELKIIVIHSEESRYKAFLDSCTHGGRELNYEHDEKKFICSSFGHSQFDLDGTRLKGPAEKPLTEFVCGLENDVIFIQI